jgi:hypothetical protein
MTGITALSIFAAIHFHVTLFFATRFITMTGITAFSIFAAIHFHVTLFFATRFVTMTGIAAFTILATIHFIHCSGFIIFAATGEFIVNIHGGFKTGIIMTHCSDLFLDLCVVGGRAGIGNGQLLCRRFPFGICCTCFFSRFFNTGLAHAAIT